MNAITRIMVVIYALILREIRTTHGSSPIGYIWVLIKTLFQISIFWILREFLRAFTPPHGMTTLSFLACGFLVWHIFSETLQRTLHAVDANKSLLVYPHVLPLEIVLARATVVVATQIVSIGLILLLGIFLGYPVHITRPDLLMVALFLALCLGIGCGFLGATLVLFFPEMNNVIPMLLRIMFFLSGVFFSVTVFVHRFGSWLLLNPVLQCIEMMRTAMSVGYISPYFDMQYLCMVNLAVMTLGLLLERFNHRRLRF